MKVAENSHKKVFLGADKAELSFFCRLESCMMMIRQALNLLQNSGVLQTQACQLPFRLTVPLEFHQP